MNSKQQNPNSLVKDTMARTAETFRQLRPQALYLTIVGLAIPLITVNYYFALVSLNPAASIMDLVAQQVGSPSISFVNILWILYDFSVKYLLAISLAFLIQCVAYVSLVRFVLSAQLHEQLPSAPEVLKLAVRTLPKLILALILSALLLTITRVFVVPAIILTILLTMVPVLLVAERVGIFKTLRNALFMKYTLTLQHSRWMYFFHLLSLGLFLFIGISLVSLVGDWLLTIDESFGAQRTLWIQHSLFLPFGFVYQLVHVISSCLISLFVAAFAFLSTSFYCEIRDRINQQPDTSLPVQQH